MVSDLVDNKSNVRVNHKMELVTVPESYGGNAMIGICYLVKEDADIIAERIDELCKNQWYDGSFWIEVLYNKNPVIVTARVVHSADVVEINIYEQLREIDSDFNQMKTDAIQVICEALEAKTDDIAYINPENGYKITEFLEGARVCDPLNYEDVKKCMKRMHAFHDLKLKVNYEFDIFGQMEFHETLWEGTPSAYKDYEITKANVPS